MVKKIEISHKTVIFTVLFLIGLYLLFQIRQILTVFFVALILMSALNPVVSRLERMKIPRVLAILIIYVLILATFSLAIAGVIPPLIEQTAILVSRIPTYIQSIKLPFLGENAFTPELSQLSFVSSNLVKFTVGIFNNILSIFILLVITFYLLIERKNLDRYLIFLFGQDAEKKAQKLVDELEKKLGGWVRAQLLLMLIIGLLSYFGLRLLGIDYALPLALLAGFLEIIPNIGPTISAVPAILAGLAISPLMGLAVFALYFLIQQVENTLIVPQVMARGTGVSPLVAIIALTAGLELAGVVGVLLAIPVVILIQITATEVFASKGTHKSLN